MALLPLPQRPWVSPIAAKHPESLQKVKPTAQDGKLIAPPPAVSAPFDLKANIQTLGLTQREFGAEIDVTESTVSRWVQGHVVVPKLVTLYLALRLAR